MAAASTSNGAARAGAVENGTVHFCFLAAAAGSDGLVDPITGYAIRLVQMILTTIDNDATWNIDSWDGSSTYTDITPAFELAAEQSQIVLPYSKFGWCQSAVGEGLGITVADAAYRVMIGYSVVEREARV